MAKKVAINGFGRIGRLIFRQLMDVDGLELVALNDIAPLDNLAYLLKYDSVHKNPEVSIKHSDYALFWDDKEVKFLSVKDPADLPWDDMEVDIAIEASGIFTAKEDSAKHLKAGAERVVITAPAKGDILTVCMGVNEDKFDPDKHDIVSNASCTTNCLAPVAKVLDEEFGLVTGFLTTVHAVTSSQAVVDAASKKWRRGRASIINIVPTTTGAAIAVTKVLPNLEGKLDGLAMRVPVANGSIIDFVVQTKKKVTVENVNDTLHKASENERLKSILGVSDEEIVSSDIIGSEYSAVVDTQSTMVLGENSVKVLALYDNEWGYARRVIDLTAYIADRT